MKWIILIYWSRINEVFVCFFFDRIDRTDLEEMESVCQIYLFYQIAFGLNWWEESYSNIRLNFSILFIQGKKEKVSLKDLLIDICDVRRVLIVCSMEKKPMRWHVPFEECLSWSKSRDFSLRRISLFRLIAMIWEWEMSKSFFRDNQSDIF